jgi:hypothetical protein
LLLLLLRVCGCYSCQLLLLLAHEEQQQTDLGQQMHLHLLFHTLLALCWFSSYLYLLLVLL